MDNAIDKVRERTRNSVDERRGSDESASGKRLTALLERGTRRLKRKEKNNNGASSLGVNHSGESGELAFSDGRSEGSLLDEDGNSSLLTDDGSDIEGYVQTIHNPRISPSYPRTLLPRHTESLCYSITTPSACVSASACSRSSAPAALASRTRTFRRRSRIVVSRYDLPRSLHLTNAPTCSWALGNILLPIDVAILARSHFLLYH